MGEERRIRRVTRSVPTMEGAGVSLRRGFGFDEVPAFDPFLLFDDFRGDDPADYRAGFPWHPHRGIETITYILEGVVEHGDSLGNSGRIGPGDVQWMTAGRGIIHQEMPEGDARGRMGGFQIWANLPRTQKMMDPRYRDVKAEEIPEVVLSGGARVKVIAGSVGGTAGPVQDIVIDPLYLDISLDAGGRFEQPLPRGHNAFAYMFSGSACFLGMSGKGRECVGDGTVVLFGDGELWRATADGGPGRFLLVAGRPLGEPVAWRGPIVMNTQDELAQAFEDYRNGTFARKPSAR